MRYRQLRSALGMELDSSVRMYINLVLGFGWDVQSLLLLERWERIPLRESAVIPLLEQKASSLTGLGMALYTQKKLRNRYHFDVILKQLALRIAQEMNLRELARLSRCHGNTVEKHLEILGARGWCIAWVVCGGCRMRRLGGDLRFIFGIWVCAMRW